MTDLRDIVKYQFELCSGTFEELNIIELGIYTLLIQDLVEKGLITPNPRKDFELMLKLSKNVYGQDTRWLTFKLDSSVGHGAISKHTDLWLANVANITLRIVYYWIDIEKHIPENLLRMREHLTLLHTFNHRTPINSHLLIYGFWTSLQNLQKAVNTLSNKNYYTPLVKVSLNLTIKLLNFKIKHYP